MIQLTNASIRVALSRLGYTAAPGQLHILGIRGASPVASDAVTRNANDPNGYNDTLCLFGSAFGLWRASVDPGTPGTVHPANPEGCAHLCNGDWLYQFGLHKGREALVQAAPVKVWRDRDRDGHRDPHEQVFTGWFGIDIHSGGFTEVNAWSLGCQVVWSNPPWGPEWQSFYAVLKASGQKTFHHFLVDAKDLVS